MGVLPAGACRGRAGPTPSLQADGDRPECWDQGGLPHGRALSQPRGAFSQWHGSSQQADEEGGFPSVEQQPALVTSKCISGLELLPRETEGKQFPSLTLGVLREVK